MGAVFAYGGLLVVLIFVYILVKNVCEYEKYW